MKGLKLNEKNRRNRRGVLSTHARINIGDSGVGEAAPVKRCAKHKIDGGESYRYGRHWYGMRLHTVGFLSRTQSLYPKWGRYFGSSVWGAIYRAGYQQVFKLQEAVTRFITENLLGLSLGLGFVFAGF